MTSAAAQAITFQFDYTYDTNNFFSTQARKDALEAAAKILEDRITDDLLEIDPGPPGGDTWITDVFNPSFDPFNSNQRIQVQDLEVSADTIYVFVGGANLGGNTLGAAGPGGYSTTTAEPFYTSVRNRGETGADNISPTNPNPPDFGPWGGAATFNTTTNWHFGVSNNPSELYNPYDPNPSLPAPGQSDFLSVAIHELAHILGFGTSPSWDAWTDAGSNTFTGPVANSVFGGPVPLTTPEPSHFANGTQSFVLATGATQEAALDPTITIGTRKLFTELDFAALDDIGWDVSPTPKPASNSTAVPTPSLLLGLLGFGGKLASKRRQQMQDDAA